MNNLLGITGGKSMGKDTVAKIINTLHQKQYKTKRFADPLKRFVADILGVSVEKLEDREFKETILGKEWWIYQNPDTGEIYPYTDPPMFKDHHKLIKLTPRIFMQLIGTDVGRVIHPQMWVNALFSSYTKDSKWIIPDTRFDNEAKAIKDRGGIIIKVEKNVGTTDTHASEKGISDEYIDIVINNNGTMRELIEKVKTILYAS